MMEFRRLIAVGAHFGHQTSRWCPKMAPYIWGHKNNVHLIDVSKTAQGLERAAKFLETTVAQGKSVLWVGTKKSAQDAVKNVAQSVEMPFVTHRWVGGTLSNYSQVKKSVTKLLHFEDIISKADKNPHYTKKEINTYGKIVERLEKNVGGIRHLSWPLGAIVVVDVLKEKSAIKEASVMGIPVIAVVDTNGDPSDVDFVIPANDDAPRVVNLLMEYLGAAVQVGKEHVAKRQAQEAEAEALAKKERAAKKAAEASQTESAREKSQEGVAAKKPMPKAAPAKKPAEKVAEAKKPAEKVAEEPKL